MTIKKRLARSNLMMLVIPVLTAGVLLIIGLAAALFLLQTVYLPQMGLSLRELHQTGEQIEALLSGLETFACIYAGAVIAALLLSIALTNLYLTRNIFRHISQPLNALTAGVARIRDGDLDAPIAYGRENWNENFRFQETSIYCVIVFYAGIYYYGVGAGSASACRTSSVYSEQCSDLCSSGRRWDISCGCGSSYVIWNCALQIIVFVLSGDIYSCVFCAGRFAGGRI